MTRRAFTAVALGIVVAAGLTAQGRPRDGRTAEVATAATNERSAVVDLATAEGVALVKGAWRYSDTKIVEVDFTGPGADGQPTGAPVRTYDYQPKAGVADFDDTAWPVIEPASLAFRRSTGRLCFNWYRINVTIPGRVGGFDPTGSTVTFETALDDYAEVWVDGEMPRTLGQRGGSVVAGWNGGGRRA
jgi:gluconolactonase